MNPGRRGWWQRLLRLALGSALLLEGLYLVGANTFLNAGGLAKAFGSTNAVNVTFERAWSFWPGTVHVRGVRVVFQDANLQWALDMQRAVVLVRLPALASRTFRATSVRGEGTVFRMRHRVAPEAAGHPSLKALAPLPEFPGPPLFEAGPPEPPIAEVDYNLWTIEIEDVDVQIAELWVQQFRYLGKARAQGAFRLRPAREVWVHPASLELASGSVRVGSEELVGSLRGSIGCRVHPFDVRKPTGTEALRHVSAVLRLHGRAVQPEALQLLFAPGEGPRVEAHGGELKVDLSIRHGRLLSPSRAELRMTQVTLRESYGSALLSPVVVVAQARPSGEAEVTLDVGSGALNRPQALGRALQLGGVRGSLRSEQLDLTAAWALRDATLEIGSLRAPDLTWFNSRSPPTLWRFDAGSATLGGSARFADGKLNAWTQTRLDGLRISNDDLQAELAGALRVELSEVRLDERSGSARLELASEATQLSSKTLEVASGGVTLKARAHAIGGIADGQVELQVAKLRSRVQSTSMQSALELKLEVTQANLFDGSTEARGELNLGDVLVQGAAAWSVRADRVGLAGNVNQRGDGSATAKLQAKLASASARAHTLRAAAEASLTLDWSRRGTAGAAHAFALKGSLRDLVLEDTSLAGSDRMKARARQLDLESAGERDASGRVRGKLDSKVVGLFAHVGNTWLRGDPELSVAMHDVDVSGLRGRLAFDLAMKDVIADDRSEGTECPWSSLTDLKLQSDVLLNGARSAQATLSASMGRARLVWGDFHASAAAQVKGTFSEVDLLRRTGRSDLTLTFDKASLRSGPGPTSGWEARIPALTLRSRLAAHESLSGSVELAAERAHGRIGRTDVGSDVRAVLNIAAVDLARRESSFSGSVELRNTAVRAGDERVEDWWARVDVESALLAVRENLDLTASLRANLRDGLPGLRVLAASGDLPAWVPEVLPLRELQVVGAVNRRCRLTDIRFTRVSGGPLSSRGRLQSVPDAVRGDFLVRLEDVGVLSAGVHFDSGHADISLFAGDDWLQQRLDLLDGRARLKLDEACIAPPRECEL